MSFQAYLDTIKEKTGMGPEDFRAPAEARGLIGPDVKAGAVLAWLQQDYGLGRGHGMAIYSILKADGAPKATDEDRLDRLFSGGKAVWRATFERLLAGLAQAGAAVELAPTDSYAGLTRGARKFAVVSPGAGHLDIGLKRPGAPFTARFAEAGAWNTMVTHRVRLASGEAVDEELLRWVLAAYEERG